MKKIVMPDLTGNSAWFRQWFDSSFYHQLYANRDEKEAAVFIDNLLSALEPAPRSCMLDLGCGAGRHAKYLASKGFRVTGLDLAFSSIHSARKAETTDLRFYRHDMRVPFGHHQFDHVFNFFTSFGYFSKEEDNHTVIRNIFNALKPGGTVVMDYINVPFASQRLVAKEEKEIDGIGYHISRWMDDRFFYKKIVIDDIRPDGPVEYVEQVAKFNLSDFDYMFRRNGLKLQQIYGNYQLDAYDREMSPRLILVAGRK